MQVLWHTMKERGRLSLNHQRFWCAHVQEDRGNYLYHWLQEKKQKKPQKNQCLLNRAANKQSDSPIGSLSVQVSRLAGVVLSAVYLVWRQMDSDNKSATRCPSRCMLSHFPSVLFLQLWDAPQNLKRNTSNYLRWRNERRQWRRQDSRQNSKCAFR